MAESFLNTDTGMIRTDMKTNKGQESDQLLITKQFMNDLEGSKNILADQTLSNEIIFPSVDDETCLEGLEKEQFNALCPWLNITDPESCINDVNLSNIELYLECSDDGESVGLRDVNHVISHGSHVIDQEGTSVIKSDVQLKISFPDFQDEKDKGFKCCCCKRKFAMECSLRDHVSIEHVDKAFVCPICVYNTKSKKFFQNHMNTKHKESSNSCAPSHASTSEEENVTVYLLTTDNEKPINESSKEVNINCENEKVEYGKSDFVVQNDNGVSIFYDITKVLSNTDCSTSINDREDNMVSNAQNVIRSNFVSTGVTVTRDIYEQGSEIRELKSTKFTCDDCGFITKSQKLLKSHQLTRHNDKREKLTCTMCGFNCLQKRTLDTHMTLHFGGHQYKCTVCRKGFLSKYSYTRHIKTHNTERKFACDYKLCRKMFKTKGALTDHKKKVHAHRMKNFGVACLLEKNVMDTITDTLQEHGIDNESFQHCTSTVSFKDDNILEENNREVIFCRDRISELSDSNERTDSNLLKIKSASTDNLPLTKGTQTYLMNKFSKQCHRVSNHSVKGKSYSKNFLCPYVGCFRKFRDNFNLMNHICTHNGVKKLRCLLCDFVCIQKTSLNHHYENKHGRK